MIEHTFYIQGSHRQTTVVAKDIVSAANDAAWLLNLTEHEQLLWLPPLPPLVRQTEQSTALTPIEISVKPKQENSTAETVMIDLVGMGRSYFPIFLQNAEQYWDTFRKSKESDLEALARYCIMLCGAIDAISSVNYPTRGTRGLASGLHRSSAYLKRRAALASTSDTSGRTDKSPVLIQSCRMRLVRMARFLAPITSA